MTRILISDLIDVPKRITRDDFVLKLTDSMANSREVVRSYVVTPQIAAAFDEALAFIGDAMTGRTSKATYLHGSFGAGKSHFMAVLHLILSGDVVARSLPLLSPIVARHDSWLAGKRFLMVPYHMLGAANLESAILGHYAEYLRRLKPGCPRPAVYASDELLADTRRLRARMGDEPFFEDLNRASAENTAAAIGGLGMPWGQMAGHWDTETFDAAIGAEPDDRDRQRLVSDLLGSHFQSFATLAGAGGAGFVPLDDGLSAISRHACGLGYDAVVLFLDELILWLSTHALNMKFVTEEGGKLVKLVENQGAPRDLPIISFVARQRDLRDLVGDHIPGANSLKFADVLKHSEARFHVITLEDRNLPEIVSRRILRPRGNDAERRFKEGVTAALRLNRPVLDTLLAGHYTPADFAKVYPFSPALIDTLVAVSSVLQRERTALKLLMELLVARRDELVMGDLVPVGDLFDVIAGGDEPFSAAMRINYDNARKLWEDKLLPMLEREHGTLWEDMAEGRAEPGRAAALRNDARILKTLVLAALVPEVASLKDLTGPRLAALNHGSIVSFIPGQEGREVVTRCQRWGQQVGEIKVTNDTGNPIVSLHISGVDTAGILANGEHFDNEGNRQAAIREMIFRTLGVENADGFFVDFTVLWRGTRRRVALCFGNVREMSDERLRGGDTGDSVRDVWTVVVDFPFDEPSFTPAYDQARIDDFRKRHGDISTVAWLPSFLSARALEDLKRLVILNKLLTGDRFDQAAAHLPPIERADARKLLSNQRDQLHVGIGMALEQAYGVRDDLPGMVDDGMTLLDHWWSLDGGFKPRPPVGANLRDAFVDLLGQLFAHLYKNHPEFPEEIKPAQLRKALEIIGQACGMPNGRLAVDRTVRNDIRPVVEPLKLGEVNENHFLIGPHWRTLFLRKLAEHGAPPTVGALRGWIAETRMGLQRPFENLIILAFAAQDHRHLFLRGALAHAATDRASLDRLDDELELRQVALPSEAVWAEARRRAALIHGKTATDVLSPANVARLGQDLVNEAQARRDALTGYAEALEGPAKQFSVPADADRLRTAHSARDLAATLIAAGPRGAVEALAGAVVATSEDAVMRLHGKAAALTQALQRVQWSLFDGLPRLEDPKAREIRDALAVALAADEHVQPLAPVLDAQSTEAVRLLTEAVRPAEPPPERQPERQPERPRPRGRLVARGARQALDAATARAVLDEIAAAVAGAVAGDGKRRLNVSWEIEEEDA